MNKKISVKYYKGIPVKKTRISTRILAWLISFSILFNPMSPALSALSDVAIHSYFKYQAEFDRIDSSSEYKYQTAPYIEESATGALNIESFIEIIKRDYSHRIKESMSSTVNEPAFSPYSTSGSTFSPYSTSGSTFSPYTSSGSTFSPYTSSGSTIWAYGTPGAINPDPFKSIGTPVVQSRFIRYQIQKLLGRHIIDVANPDYSSESTQIDTLYGNALNFLSSNGATRSGKPLYFGTPLISPDNTGLMQDMIWPEIRVVSGELVMVPVVYLSSSTLDKQSIESNVVEFQSDVFLGSLLLEGIDIRFGRDTFFRVVGDLRNNQGSISGDGDLSILAGGNLVNLSGLIQSNGDLSIGAHDIVNQTIVYRYLTNGNSRTETGSYYGAISAINSVDGSVTLTSYNDIVFQGAVANAAGSLSLIADGSIFIGSQQLVSSLEASNNISTTQTSSVSFLQSSLTAADTIKLIAAGTILIDAAEIVSDEGHIELLAGMGITIEDDLQEYRSYSAGEWGKTSWQESEYKTVAIRALLDAGKGVRIHSDFGDITLKAANISSTQGTSVNAANGAVNLLMTVENDHYSYNSTSKGMFTITTINKGHEIETGVPNTIVGGLVVEALNGVRVEYEGNSELTLDQQISDLSQFEGLAWMADVRNNTPDVDWNAIELKYNTWDKKTTSLSPAFAAVVSIAIAIVTGGAGTDFAAFVLQETATTALGTAIAAGATAFISQASLALANGAVNGDIAQAMDDFVSNDLLKSLAVSMVTAGALHNLNNAEFFELTDGATELSLGQQSVQAVTHATVQAGVSNIISGGDFEDSFLQALGQNAIYTIGESLATKIGIAAKGNPEFGVEPSIGTASQYIAHAAVGCLTGGLTASLNDGDTSLGCTSGAGGAVIGEIIGQQYEESLEADLNAWVDERLSNNITLTREEIFNQAFAFKQRGVDMSRLGAGITAFVTGGDVNIAASAGGNAADNNAIFLIAIIATAAYTSYVSYQEGGLYEGLQSIGRGDDPLAQAIGGLTTSGIEFLVEEFPDAAADTAAVLTAVGEVISEGVSVVLETPTGRRMVRFWNEIPEADRNALIGAGAVVSFVIPAGVVTKLKTLSNLEVEPGDWVRDSNHPNWELVNESDRDYLNDRSVGAAEWGLIPERTTTRDGTVINVYLDYKIRDHALYGEINARGDHVGGHSTNSGDVELIGNVEIAGNGVRRGPVNIYGKRKDNTKNGNSTLFPEEWSDADIMREFSEGLKNGKAIPYNWGYTVTTPGGVKVFFGRDGTGRITSWYPIFE